MQDQLVLANAEAGSADEDTLDRVVEIIGREVAVEVRRPDGPAALDAVLADRGGRALLVAGGDGSLHLVIDALHRRGELAETVVGLIPMGTGNDFARTVGIPLDAEEAAAVVLHGTTRSVDLLVDGGGGVVVNAVHLGVGAMAGDAATDLKPRLGRLAYPVGAVKAGIQTSGWRMRVVADGTELVGEEDPVLMIGIGNGTSIGGGTELAPGARVDDGAVDVIISRSVAPTARIGFAADLSRGRHESRDDVTAVRARKIEVAGESIPINVDGEIGDPIERQEWRVEPAAWRIRTPAASE